MTKRIIALPTGKNAGGVAVFMLSWLLFAGTAIAQTMPYESSMRSQVGTGLDQRPMKQGVTFIPRVDSAVQYAYNLNLAAESKDRVSSPGLELAPGFYASYQSGAVTAAVDYSVIGRLWGDSDYNAVSQLGAANGRWTALPDLFYIDAQAGITEDVVNAKNGVDYGEIGVFGTDNLTQVATAGVTPTLDRKFGEYGLLAQYSYGAVWYFDQPDESEQFGFINEDNSTNQSANVSFGNQGSQRRLTGNVFFDWQKTDYENALPYNYEEVGANISWEIRPRLSLVGTYGIESDLYESTTQGGLDSTFWTAGFSWQPDSRTTAEARYGERFFGHTYYLNVARTTRMFEFEASYSETPSVQSQILSLGDFNPGELPPVVDPGIDFGRLSSQPYIGKNAAVGVTAVGSRTRVGLEVFRYVQDYVGRFQDVPALLISGNDQTNTGGVLSVTRELASNLSVDSWISYTNYDQYQFVPDDDGVIIGTAPFNYDDFQLVGRLNREASGGKLITSFEAGFFDRSGSDSFIGWWIGFRARWYP